MWPFNGDRITQRLNTVDLNDDLDDVEMLEAIERAFSFKISSVDAEGLVSVGDLYDLVKSKMPKDGKVDPVWELVEIIVRSHSGSIYPIDRKTTFFPKYASERE